MAYFLCIFTYNEYLDGFYKFIDTPTTSLNVLLDN